jgi:hypothetical protein
LALYAVFLALDVTLLVEMKATRRVPLLLSFVAFAQLSLLLFAIVPAPWNALCLFLNGLPLGMVFGLVLGFLVGRRVTELMTAGLCASFILADGVTKSVGTALLAADVPTAWMPFAAGAIFILPLCAFVWMLSRVTPPDALDLALRSERAPMSSTVFLHLIHCKTSLV